MSEPRVSVVIRSKNEETGIGRVLELLSQQTIGKWTEVIVVDSGSTDRTPAIARASGAEVIEIPAATFTFGDSLNRGCAAARGPVVVALSAHAFPPDERWLERLLGRFDDPRVACASGSSYAVVQDLDEAIRNPFTGYSNAAGAFRLDLWRERAFRPEMPGTEDKEWSWWWLRRGYVHVAAPDLLVDHDHSKDPVREQFIRSRREWIGFDMYLELGPYRLRELLTEWWTQQDGYRSPSRARMSHRRGSRLLGKYAGRRRSSIVAQARQSQRILDRVRAQPQPGVAVPPVPLRVAVMIDEFPTLSETFVTAELQALRHGGHLVTVEAVEPARVANPVELPRLRTSFVTEESLGAKAAALTLLLLRYPHRCARDLFSRGAWRDEEVVTPLRALACRARRMHRERVEHMHVHFAHRSALEALRIGRLLGLPYSVTAHAWDIYLDPRNLVDKLERSAFSTSGCDYTVEHLRTLLSPDAGRRVHRIVMGVDNEVYKRTIPLPGGRTVLAVGRLVEKKGFEDLIEAVALIGRDRDVEQLVIVGGGPLRGRLEALVRDRRLDGMVHLEGALAPQGVRAALEQADLLAMPCIVASSGDRDSMPVAVKEAMAMELMVVGTDEVGLPEMVDDTRGRLVPPSDPKALAEAIVELLALPLTKRAELGASGRDWVLRCADVHTEAAKLARLIETAARGDRQAASSER